jgi:hypothetical protein
MNIFQRAAKGFKTTDLIQREFEKNYPEYATGQLSVGNLGFAKALAAQGVTAQETPVQFLGAYTARLVTDLTNDGTRTLFWRYNHPNAIADISMAKAIGKETRERLGPLQTGLVTTAALGPALAVSGAYDLFNISEVGRPKGFAQTYAEEGSEDRRKTEQPVQEAFERFFLGRTGRPLAYEEAKKDIPDLTPERYGNFLRNYYQDRGLLGIVKATPENLEGVPELRMLGYPVTIPSALGVAGGATAVATASRLSSKPMGALRLGAVGFAGSLAGIAAGNIVNEVIAAGNRPKLPTTAEYESVGY